MPPTKTRALLLDLDGTLADSLGAMKSVYRRFMEKMEATPSDAEFDRLNGPPIAECVRILKATHGLPQPESELLARYQALIEEVYGAVPPRAGAKALIEAARARGWTVGVVTSNGEACTRSWLARAGLANLIDMVVGGDAVQRGKPAPDPYRAALALANCAPIDSLAIEDSPQGAESARSAGIPTLALLRDPNHSISGWPAGVDFIASLADARQRIEAGD